MYRSSSSIKARINRKIVHAQCAPNFWPTNYLCAQKINPKCTGLSLLIFASWFQLRLCIHAWNGETIITVRKLRPATINMHILFNIYIYIDRYIYVVKWWKRVSCCIIITNLAFPIVPSFTHFNWLDRFRESIRERITLYFSLLSMSVNFKFNCVWIEIAILLWSKLRLTYT